MNAKKVLAVVSNGHRMDNGQMAGVWFSELAEPLTAFVAQGLEVTVASPRGGACHIDPASLKGGDPECAEETKNLLRHTLALSQAKASDYDGIFLCGGHGAMFDFPQDVQLQNLLTDFSTSAKPIGAVCHGVAGLVGAKLDKGNWLVEGRTVTGFTNAEEAETGKADEMPFLLETKLRELEAHFMTKPNGEDHVEVDGGLVTGQNPQSAASTAREFAKLVNESDRGIHARPAGGILDERSE
ncbi:type 1 glutamine amidotransferase domain-containing protein [Cohnella nanjingensis]|uniref:Type 1 glutamine amidotransferase domain-containing protein n=1 Tax=Cohnella nanjingensis TaxID=1387779 RepID=A0A7X0RSA0_9BACL|nr:type 1 glutamine amidotransferase domain-containing protein [Cohnella nanjingensis]MBB6672764.1 type 1 glutamine amidotransferase domain-containing protein [Cohnella nanjingensis]